MLVRDTPSGAGGAELEVLMVQRHLRTDFVGGAFVFPGGPWTPSTEVRRPRRCARAQRCRGQRSARGRLGRPGLLGGGGAARPSRSAGSSSAASGAGPAPSAGGPDERARLAAGRAGGQRRDPRFLELCRGEHLELLVGDVQYFARWITPMGSPRRYDTRFFVAAAPPVGQAAPSSRGETVAAVWITPPDALARHRRARSTSSFPRCAPSRR